MKTAKQIADYILFFAHDSGSFISNLKLQKLLYYTQAWHLALKDRPLFDGKFEAWVHGPVHNDTYQIFKVYGYKNIDAEVSKPELDDETESFLKEVMEEYFPLDAYQLEQLTHQESPWIIARGNLPPTEPSNAVISESEMTKFYRAQANG
jgi:uncharacterized phage-associated protein